MIEEDIARLIELNEKIVNQNYEIIRLLLKLAGEDNKNDDSLNNSEIPGADYEVLVNEGGEVLVHSDLSGISLGDFGAPSEDKVTDKKEDKDVLAELGLFSETGEKLFDSKLDVGEVFFIGNSDDGNIDIYKLSIKKSDEFKVYPKELEEDIRNNICDYNCEITIDNLTGNGITNQYNIPLIVANESLVQNTIINSDTVILDDKSFDNLPDILKLALENGAKKVHLSLKNGMAVINAPPVILEYLEFYKNYEQIFDKIL